MEQEIIAIDGFVIGEIYKNTSLSDMTGETWKDIPGFEGRYQASSLGRIKSLNYRHTGKEGILEQRKNRNGYLQVNLCKNGKRKQSLVHRLVAEAFSPNPEGKPDVDHINNDGPKTDCLASNRRWVTSIENKNNGQSKKILCVETNIVYHSSMDAKRKTGADNSSIIKCCRGKLKSTGGYHWRYAD